MNRDEFGEQIFIGILAVGWLILLAINYKIAIGILVGAFGLVFIMEFLIELPGYCVVFLFAGAISAMILFPTLPVIICSAIAMLIAIIIICVYVGAKKDRR